MDSSPEVNRPIGLTAHTCGQTAAEYGVENRRRPPSAIQAASHIWIRMSGPITGLIKTLVLTNQLQGAHVCRRTVISPRLQSLCMRPSPAHVSFSRHLQHNPRLRNPNRLVAQIPNARRFAMNATGTRFITRVAMLRIATAPGAESTAIVASVIMSTSFTMTLLSLSNRCCRKIHRSNPHLSPTFALSLLRSPDFLINP